VEVAGSSRPPHDYLRTPPCVLFGSLHRTFGKCRLLLSIYYETNSDFQGGAPFSVYGFFQYNLGLILIVGCTVGYKLIMRTKLVDPKTADLVHGRRTLSTEEIMELDAYYGMSSWRRFCTYVQLW
jgi:hypothetical protein